MQVLNMVTLAFTFTGALAGLMGMNLYFAVATTPRVSQLALVHKSLVSTHVTLRELGHNSCVQSNQCMHNLLATIHVTRKRHLARLGWTSGPVCYLMSAPTSHACVPTLWLCA